MAKRKSASGAARIQGALVNAVEVLVVEAGPGELDRADVARLRVTGDEIGGLARALAVVDGGFGGRCLCVGWPTIVVSGPDGRELARWTVHHQTQLRGVGDSDLALRDGPALTGWLAARGLTGSRDAQLALARQAQESAQRGATGALGGGGTGWPAVRRRGRDPPGARCRGSAGQRARPTDP